MDREAISELTKKKTWYKQLLEAFQNKETPKQRKQRTLKEWYQLHYDSVYQDERRKFLKEKAEEDAKKAARRNSPFEDIVKAIGWGK